jgi:sulfur carrier protein ThiS
MSLITLQFNGQPLQVPVGTTIEQLLALADIVPRELHASQQVASGDVIEAVTLVGGG